MEAVGEDFDDEEKFISLLDEHATPFTPWDKQRDMLASDSRYVSVSSDGHRRTLFSRWEGQQQVSTSREEEFRQFVLQKYKPGMVYPLFRRKHFSAFPDLPDKSKEAVFRSVALK